MVKPAERMEILCRFHCRIILISLFQKLSYYQVYFISKIKQTKKGRGNNSLFHSNECLNCQKATCCTQGTGYWKNFNKYSENLLMGGKKSKQRFFWLPESHCDVHHLVNKFFPAHNPIWADNCTNPIYTDSVKRIPKNGLSTHCSLLTSELQS